MNNTKRICSLLKKEFKEYSSSKKQKKAYQKAINDYINLNLWTNTEFLIQLRNFLLNYIENKE